MTTAEAVLALEAAGLEVFRGPGGHIDVAAGHREPIAELKAKGAVLAWSFGLSIYQVDREWAVKRPPSATDPHPTEFFAHLQDAVGRAIVIYRDHRQRASGE